MTVPVLTRTNDRNTQRIYRFPNGYGASVVIGPYTYGGPDGKFELAVLSFDGPKPTDFDIDYSTSVTDDVIGWLSAEEVDAKLALIAALEATP